jgi:hypothetical protein
MLANARLAALSALVVACSSSSDLATDAGIDSLDSTSEASASDLATDAGIDGLDSTSEASSNDARACSMDAGADGLYPTLEAATTDPRCPAQWADLTDSNGIPTVCTVDGLLCVYPQGQAVCAPDGLSLKWWQGGPGPGCTELPPALCQPCTAPGIVYGYLSGAPPSDSNFVTNLCCNGNTGNWGIEPNDGCPNGNVCGTIQASDYDQSCAKAADCAGVTVGDLCTIGCTDCTNAAINVTSLAQYNTDFAKKAERTSRLSLPPGGHARVQLGRLRVRSIV